MADETNTTAAEGSETIPSSPTDGPAPAETPKAVSKKGKGKAVEPATMNLPDGTVRIDN